MGVRNGEDEDLVAAREYIQEPHIIERIAVAYNHEHPDAITEAIRQAFLQGWHEAMNRRGECL